MGSGQEIRDAAVLLPGGVSAWAHAPNLTGYPELKGHRRRLDGLTDGAAVARRASLDERLAARLTLFHNRRPHAEAVRLSLAGERRLF